MTSIFYKGASKDITPVLKAAPGLTSFSMRIDDATTATDIVSTVLSTACQLDALSVDATGFDLDFSGLAPKPGTSWPGLTAFSLKAERFNPSLEVFLSHHKSSLQRLRLEWTEDPAEFDDATFTFSSSTTFPAFRSSELRECGTSPLIPLLSAIKESNLPALQQLAVVPRFHDLEDWNLEHSGIANEFDLLHGRITPATGRPCGTNSRSIA